MFDVVAVHAWLRAYDPFRIIDTQSGPRKHHRIRRKCPEIDFYRVDNILKIYESQ